MTLEVAAVGKTSSMAQLAEAHPLLAVQLLLAR